MPMTIFCKDGFFTMDSLSSSSYDVIGVDWSTTPEMARQKCPSKILQGNLDPCALYGSPENIKNEVKEMISEFGTSKYIVNLGHGIYPDASPDHVEAFIEAVHSVQIQ